VVASLCCVDLVLVLVEVREVYVEVGADDGDVQIGQLSPLLQRHCGGVAGEDLEAHVVGAGGKLLSNS
jgi:hypothetical protein